MQVDIGAMDWELLRKQKEQLVKITQESGKSNLPLTLPTEASEAVDGMLNLLDRIQDQAADQIGSMAVFGFES